MPNWLPHLAALICISSCNFVLADDENTPVYRPQLIAESYHSIAEEDLRLLLKPLTADELKQQADICLVQLKNKTQETSILEINVRNSSDQLDAIDEIRGLASHAKTTEADDIKALEKKVEKKLEIEAFSHIDEKTKAIDLNSASDVNKLITRAADAEQRLTTAKTSRIQRLSDLRDERKALADKLHIILLEWESKGGDVKAYQLYINAVTGLKLDVTDTSGAWLTIINWAQSKEGGIRWAINSIKLLLALFVFIGVSMALGKLVDKLLSKANASQLMSRFVSLGVRRGVLFIGFMVALTIMEFNIAPLLAIIGAAGLVIGLALQSTLSNFASGILMLVYRPFDLDDVICIENNSCTVKKMTLFSTTVTSFDNTVLVVPNNTIWGGVIINYTTNPVRRVDLIFGISYSDDIDTAKAIIWHVLEQHPKILKKPEAAVRVDNLGDSSVNLLCRPWTKTENYWDVYWDLQEQVKKAFDEGGISIPFPQRDVHMITSK